MRNTRVLMQKKNATQWLMSLVGALLVALAPHHVLLAQQTSVSFPDPLGGVGVSGLIQRVISGLLLFVGVLFFVLFLWGGIQWLTAGGSEDQIKKARTTLVNSVIGLLIVMLAYALVNTVIDTIVAAK